MKKILFMLAAGRITEIPFSEACVEEAFEALKDTLRERGATGDLDRIPFGQPFRLRLIGEFLRLTGDPDWRIFDEHSAAFSKGVDVGNLTRLPRTPAVFKRKEKFRKYDLEEEFNPWKENYKTAADNAQAIEKQLEVEERLGRVVTITEEEARKRYGDRLRVAAIIAIDKGDGVFRICNDQTHGVHSNWEIRPRDQYESPSIGEQKTIMTHFERKGGPRFGLKGDVESAHRLVLNHEEDWGSQACQLRSGLVILNKVGTQGCGSAGYWWARLAAGLQRLGYYVACHDELWTLLYADDLNWSARGPRFHEAIILQILLWILLGTPFSWRKFGGGLQYDWIGYWMDWERFEVGLSEKRGLWVAAWLKRKRTEGVVDVKELQETLGRLNFAANAIDHVSPFLGPIYAWVASVPLESVLPLPKMLSLIFLFLEKVFGDPSLRVSHAKCPKGFDGPEEDSFRGDAKAEGEDVGLGGWESRGGQKTEEAPWFYVKLTRQNAPWAFEGGEPYRKIASLELLTSLLAVMAFNPLDEGPATKLSLSGSNGMRGLTDNLGNRYVVRALATTAFPLCCILMELSIQLLRRNAYLSLDWVPREGNKEADALSEGSFHGFDPAKRIEVDLASMKFEVLNELLEHGAELYSIIRQGKAVKDRYVAPRPKAKKRRLEDKLKTKDPW